MGEPETEADRTRAETASYLRDLADRLDAGGDATLALGGEQVRVDPTTPVTFKLEGESDWSAGETEAKRSIEFELVRWRDVQSSEDGSLDVASGGEWPLRFGG